MKIYVVFRYYNNKERPDVEKKERYEFYGWSTKPEVIEAFQSQRDPRKYKVQKYTREELGRMFGENAMYPESKIDYVNIPIAATGERMSFFTTAAELMSAEKKVLRMMSDLARLVDKDEGRTRLLSLYINLDDWYKDALEYIGFIPPELSVLFDSKDETEEAEEAVDNLFSGYPNEENSSIVGIENLSALNYDYQKVIYSMESFIKVLVEDL